MRGLLAVLKDNWVDSEPPKTLVDFAKTRIKDTKHCEFSFKGPCLGAVANCAISFSGRYTGPHMVKEKLSDLQTQNRKSQLSSVM